MKKQLLRLAIPNIISNLSVPLLGAVDTALMGHLESSAYIGAIAVGGIIFSFIYWSFGFLRMGTTGLTAQANGKEDKQESGLVLGRAILTALIGSCLVLLLQVPIIKTAMLLIESSMEVKTIAIDYYNIRIWAAPATIALYAFYGWFLGMQNAIYPMAISIGINLLNLLLNIVFLKYFGMKADGVALGTLIAQYTGVFIAIILILWKYNAYIKGIRLKLILKINALKKFLFVNFDIFLRTLCLIFTFSFFTVKSASQGDNILAINQILLQLMMLLSYGIDGFAYAAESLVGKYFGASDKSGLKKAIRYSFIGGLITGGFYLLIYVVFNKPILNIFTDKLFLLEGAQKYYWWILVATIINVFPYIWDGVYIGVTASKPMRNTMLIATFLIFVPTYYIGLPYLGNDILWFALELFMIARGVGLWMLNKRYIFIQ